EQGAADALSSLYSKTIMAGFTNLADAYRAPDRLRVLALADLKRHEYLPNVPTFKELGYDIDNSSVNFRGFAFPVGVPNEIVEYAAKTVEAMFKDPVVVAKMKESGSPLNVIPRAEMKKLFAQQKAVLTELLATTAQK
ncbi:MAG: tripartite tricarboxylate transporter substrate binding protein, partial [Deltaproteobacteria bacterium]|nr:tripartite tricarboxylate transporter substrate binding protein [Deltaproteobacteria bacterium]